MPRLFDANGNEWPLGTVTKTWTTDFDDGTLPSWLSTTNATVAASTSSPQGGTSGLGGVEVTSTASNKRLLGETFDSTDRWLASVSIKVTHTPSSLNGALMLGCVTPAGLTGGGAAWQGSGSGTGELRVWDTGGAMTPAASGDVSLAGASGVRQTNEVRVDFHDWDGRPVGGVHLWINGAYYLGWDFGPALGLNTLAPMLDWSGQGSGVTDHIHQLTITKVWI